MGLPDPARSRAVLIGVDGYDYLEALPAVRNNVRRLAELLRDRAVWGLPERHCVVLHNPRSADAVLDAVREAASVAEDAFVLYFAGHGLVAPTRRADLLLALRGSVRDRWYGDVSYNTVRHVLADTCTASARVVLLDCCFSGRPLEEYMSPSGLADLAAVEGTYVMTATSGTQLAQAPQGEEFTAFTGELVKALTEGVPGADDPLEMGDLFRHVRRELHAKSRPEPQQQARNAGHSIALTRNRWRAPVGLHEDPIEPGTAVDEPPLGSAPQLVESRNDHPARRGSRTAPVVRTVPGASDNRRLPEDPPPAPADHSAQTTPRAGVTMPPPTPRPSPPPSAPAETAVVSRVERAWRLFMGSCCLVVGLGGAIGVSFGISETSKADQVREGIGAPVFSALVAVVLGLAVQYYRWKGPGKPPRGIISKVFLPVFLPLTLFWEVWIASLG